jgi:hypothetical protein
MLNENIIKYQPVLFSTTGVWDFHTTNSMSKKEPLPGYPFGCALVGCTALGQNLNVLVEPALRTLINQDFGIETLRYSKSILQVGMQVGMHNQHLLYIIGFVFLMLLVPRLLLFRTLEDQILASFPSNI